MSSSTLPDKLSRLFDFTSTRHSEPYPFISPLKQNLNGRSVFITGASKGIGRATVISFAQAGASYIAIGARSSLDSLINEIKAAAEEAKREEPTVLPLQLDVTDRQSVEDAAKRIKEEFGKLDILINNAGYLEPFILIADSDPLEWWHSWTVNMNGVYLVTRSCLPLLLNTEGGLKTILNVSSIGALLSRPGASAYQTAKLALLRFGQFLNAEYSSQGLLSYGIHPGGVLTELGKGMPKELHAVLTDTPELGAESIVWLTSQRKEWLAGRYISVNWDMQEFEGMREEVEKGDLLKAQVTT